MKLTEKLNDFWEFMCTHELPVVLKIESKYDSIYHLELVRLYSNSNARLFYRIKEGHANDHDGIWFVSDGVMAFQSNGITQIDARDVFNDGFIPDANFILGQFFHHFTPVPHLPTLKTIALKTLKSQKQ